MLAACMRLCYEICGRALSVPQCSMRLAGPVLLVCGGGMQIASASPATAGPSPTSRVQTTVNGKRSEEIDRHVAMSARPVVYVFTRSSMCAIVLNSSSVWRS